MIRSSLLAALFLFASVAGIAQTPYYNKTVKDWETQFPAPTGPVEHTVFLIGDAGELDPGSKAPHIKVLEDQLAAADTNSSIVFLGDNIYPAGLPSEADPEARKEAEAFLMEQLKTVKNFKGRTFFIPGNHDWNKYGKDGRQAVKRQEQFVENYLQQGNTFLPDDGCPGPVEIQLSDNLVLLVLDTEWWIHKWKKESDMHTGCKIKTRHDFSEALIDAIAENDDQNILVAAHHPIFSNGAHGGYFTLRQHLFPLTDKKKKLFLPLPVIGSIYPIYRYVFGHPQDIPHAQYQKFIEAWWTATFRKRNIVYAAGHEHSLQYFSHKFNHYIVSGAGCKHSAIRKGQGAEFAYSKEGFTKMLYLQNGEVWSEFWVADKEAQPQCVFRKKLRDKTRQAGDAAGIQEDFPDSVTSAASTIYKATKSHQKWWGEHYRDAWTTPVKAPVLNLNDVHGGLKPIKKGGGQQTNSLRLEAPNGRQYVLRSIAKDVKKLVPDIIKGTVWVGLVQDQISMSHPYGAFVVPPMAEGAGIFHTNPQLVYVPKQAALGDYNEVFGNEYYLFEERPKGDLSDQANFGNSHKIVSYNKLLQQLYKNHKSKVDQKQVLRSRLFDLWLGDWDRHDDQWRWASRPDGDKTIYQPIPRDRDQVFLRMEGILPKILTSNWGLRQFEHFDYKVHDVKGLSFNAKYFDRTFLTEQDRKDWIKMAEDLSQVLTDSLIENGLHQWPDTIYELNGKDIAAKLRARRDGLTKIASDYYDFLAVDVNVVGTNQRELFEVERINNMETKVQMFALSKDGNKKEKLYERVFNRKETEEIRLYGLEGKDVFKFKGAVNKGILVRAIGGPDRDDFKDESSVNGLKKHTRIYDTESGNEFELGSESKNLSSTDPDVNLYNRTAFKFNHFLPIAFFGFNLDDGILVGGGFRATKYGFRKDPYRYRQTLIARYAIETKALSLKYTGDFISAFAKEKLDIHLDAHAFAPTYVHNYFGLGNETRNDANDLNFNRLRHGQVMLNPALKKSFHHQVHTFKIGPRLEITNVEQSEGRFVDVSALPDDFFKTKTYAGLKLEYHLNKVDNQLQPSRGLKMNFSTSYNANLDDLDLGYTRLAGDLAFYFSFDFPVKTTVGTRVGGAINRGEYEFFQANSIGRRSNLRGFRGERFRGDDAFYHNTDLRMKLFNFKNPFLPGSVGLVGLFDYGRVWLEGENSSAWHQGYGGGLWFSPLDQGLLSVLYTASDDDAFVEVKFGFFF